MAAAFKHRLSLGFMFLAEFLDKAGNFIIFPLLIHYLGAQGFGVQAQLGMISGVLVPIAMVGLSYNVVRLVAGETQVAAVTARFWSTFLVVLGTSGVLAGAMLAAAPLLNDWFIRVDWAPPVIRWSAPLIILSAVERTLSGYYRARLYIIAYSIFEILQSLAFIAAVVAVLVAGGGLLQVVIASLAVKAVAVTLAFAYFLSTGEVKCRGPLLPRADWIEMVRFGTPIVVMSISLWMMHYGDRAVVGYYLNSKALGVYAAAYSLASLLLALADPFWASLYPLMAIQKNKGDAGGLKSVCRKYCGAYLLIAIPALLGLTALASPLLQALGSREFAINPLTFALIAMGLFVDQFAATSRFLVYLHNEPGFMRNITFFSGIVKLGFNIVTVPLLGIFGAALATLLAFGLLETLLLRWTVSHGYRLDELYDFPAIGRQFICAALMALVVYWAAGMAGHNLIRLLGVVVLGAVSYGTMLWAVNGFKWRRMLNFA
jgi:O-antigen/teichoic acid export membrane protein